MNKYIFLIATFFSALLASCGNSGNSNCQKQDPYTTDEFVTLLQSQIDLVHNEGNPHDVRKINYTTIIEGEREVIEKFNLLMNNTEYSDNTENKERVKRYLQDYITAVNAYHWRAQTSSLFSQSN